MRWVGVGHVASYPRAPVAALDDVPVVAQLEHELVHSIALMMVLEPRFVRIRGEAVPEKGGSDDVEPGVIE